MAMSRFTRVIYKLFSIVSFTFVVCLDASATLVTFFVYGNGASAGEARPNSNAAFQAFQQSLGAANVSSIITFEGLNVGTIIPSTPLNLGLGVSVASDAFCCGAISASNSVVDGYNVTDSGSKYLQFVPNPLGGDLEFTFSFPSAIK